MKVHFLKDTKALCGDDLSQDTATFAKQLVTCEECKKNFNLYAITFGETSAGTLVDVGEKGYLRVFYFTEEVGRRVIEEFGDLISNASLENKDSFLFSIEQEQKDCGSIDILTMEDWERYRETFEELRQ